MLAESPLTPALSLPEGGRENSSPSLRKPGAEDSLELLMESATGERLFPLPFGRGEGEGEGIVRLTAAGGLENDHPVKLI
jgi:hypothetical protein